MNFQLSLLGGFGLSVDGKSLRFATRKESSLYAYLTLYQEKGAVRRERLAGLLWPDVDDQRARRNLSTALWRIKVILDKNEASLLAPHTSQETVGIKLPLESVDVLRFQWLLEASDGNGGKDRLSILKEAESLYAGDLLEEFQDEWCEEARRYLRGQYVNVLRQLSDINKNEGQYSSALQFARKLVAVEPLDEEGNKELMLIYHLAGDRRAALNQFETLRKNLREDLGIEPNEATTQLWEYIRTTAPDVNVSVRPTPRGTEQSTDPRVPLIGRETYINTLIDCLQNSVTGRGSAILISGEAGIGKTKLVETIATEARLRDIQVLQGRCPELQNPPPYQVILQALWPRVVEATRADEPGSLLGAILKALSFHGGSTKRPRRNPEPTLNTTIVMEAILELLKSGSAGKPTLLILEDIHRIDQASLTLLASLLDRISPLPLVVLATLRTDEKKSAEIILTLTANGALHHSLPPLNEAELQRLVRAVLRDKSVSQDVLNLVWDRTDGVPLFALELVDFMVSGGHIHKASSGIWELRDKTAGIPAQFPSRVNEVIRRRIELLIPQSKKILEVGAVLGIEFSPKHVSAITSIPEDLVAESLERLVDCRLIVQFDDRYRFRHETIRTVVLELSAYAKRQLHLRTGEILEKTSDTQPEDLYLHFMEANNRDKALHYAEVSGDKARAVHANENATMWYSKAVELLEDINSRDPLPKDIAQRKVQLLIKRHEVLEVIGDPNRLAHINSIRALVSTFEDKRLLAQVEYLRARTIARSKTPRDALVPAMTACKLYRQTSDPQGEATAKEILGEIHMNLRDYDRARIEFDRAINLFRKTGDRIGEARVIATGSIVLSWLDIEAALASFERAESLLEGSEELRIRAKILLQKGICYRILGLARISESSLRAGLELACRIGDRLSEARGRSQLAATLSALGRHAEAIKESRHGLRLARQTRDDRSLITGLNNAAYYSRYAGALRNARTAAVKALRMIESVSPGENAVMYMDTLATVLLAQGDTLSALKVALQAKKLSSSRKGAFARGEVYHHLGTIYLARKQYNEAIPYLQRAVGISRSTNDLCTQLLATASLILALIRAGETKLAAMHAHRIAGMMRGVESLEEIQLIFWSQYRAFSSVGRSREARRALNRAYNAVLTQASSLKGGNRHRFLSLHVNRTILAEAANLSLTKTNHRSPTIEARALTTAGSNWVPA